MKKIIAVFSGLIVAMTMMFVAAPPASADTGGLYHLINDSGYNASFTVQCLSGHVVYVGLGQSTDTLCGNNAADRVYVHANEKYRCERDDFTFYTWITAQGWHDIGSVFRSCVVQRD